MSIDNLFLDPESRRPFEFNQAVADVFDNMLNRSVPFYSNILDQIVGFTDYYLKHSNLLSKMADDTLLSGTKNSVTLIDLGCSTGALARRLIERQLDLNYIGVDSSVPMIKKAMSLASNSIQFRVSDIRDLDSFSAVDIIVCNLVLQFVSVDERQQLLERFFHNLPSGGMLIVVEKVHHYNSEIQAQYLSMFRDFKQNNGYSMDEILNKEQSIQGVLISQTESWYEEQLKTIGFSNVDTFFKWCNFVGLIAIK